MHALGDCFDVVEALCHRRFHHLVDEAEVQRRRQRHERVDRGTRRRAAVGRDRAGARVRAAPAPRLVAMTHPLRAQRARKRKLTGAAPHVEGTRR